MHDAYLHVIMHPWCVARESGVPYLADKVYWKDAQLGGSEFCFATARHRPLRVLKVYVYYSLPRGEGLGTRLVKAMSNLARRHAPLENSQGQKLSRPEYLFLLQYYKICTIIC